MTRSRYPDQPLTVREDSVTNRDRDAGTPHSNDPSASGNLDKIREILFGDQVREHERRFAQLEQHLIRESADLRNDLKRRFDLLEGYIKKEIDVLTGRLTKEQEVRGESVTSLTQGLTHLSATFEEKARQIEMQAAQAHTHVLEQLTERTNELAADIRARHAEATSALKQAIHDLRAEQTDRATLAAILREASQRLSNDDANAVRA